MNCLRHPQRPVFSICQKFGRGYCEECFTCADPQGYCRYRTRCLGWQLRKRRNRGESGDGPQGRRHDGGKQRPES